MEPRTKIGIVAVALLSLTPFCLAHAQAPVVVGATPEIPGVVERGSLIQRILEGYDGLDDPLGMADGSLVFAEPGARMLHRMNTETEEVSVLVADSNESHGVNEDSQGRLISVQALDGSQQVGVIYPEGSEDVLADEYDGLRFSRPNDLILASNGGVYFTDPGLTAGQAAGLVERYGGTPLGPRLPPAVYYIAPGQAPVRIEDNMIRPNGIQLNRDETTLYISDSNGEHVIGWDIQVNGLVTNRREFGTLQGRSNRDNGLGGVKSYADGMAVDDDDRLYVATGGGVEVLNAQGEHLGIIPVRCLPRDCQNLAFSGPNKQTLYIAGAGSLYKVEMIARGLTTRAK
jgi:gluconolactonase